MDGFELSVQQRRLLENNGLAGVRSTCTIAVHDLRFDQIAAGLDVEVARHEALRTRFEVPVGLTVPLQVIDAQSHIAITHSGETAIVSPAGCSAVFTAALADSDDSGTLTLSAPTAIADAYSLSMVLLNTIAAASGKPLDTETEEPLQYADYAAWQQEMLEATDAGALEATSYWRTQDHDRVTRFDEVVQSQPLHLKVPAATLERVENAARRVNCQPSTMWLAAWSALLDRAAPETPLCIAVMVDGRQNDELVGTIGSYLTAVPVAFAPLGESSVADLMAHAESSCRLATRHALRPLAKFIASAGFQYSQLLNAEQAGGVLSRSDAPSSAEPQCEVRSLHNRVELVFTADARLQELAQEHFIPLLDALAGAIESGVDASPVRSISIWETTARSAALTAGVAPKPTNRFHAQSLYGAIAAVAHEFPNRTAVVAGDGELTYAELIEQAHAIATQLKSLGAAAKVPVGIFLDRSTALVAAVLGVLESGAPYVPLHLEYPIERLALQLETTHVSVVITTTALESMLPSSVTTLCIDHTHSQQVSDADVVQDSVPNDLAYVIFTSGSTGVPKGVGVTNANLLAYASGAAERLLSGGPNDAAEQASNRARSFAVVTSLSTDLGNTSLVLALTTGGSVQIVPHEVAIDAHSFAAWNRSHPVDVLKITPSHLRALLSGGFDVLPRELLIVGGESLSWQLVRDVEALSPCAIANHYGPTETTIGALTYAVERGTTHVSSATVPIGHPLSGYRAYVLDPFLEPTPIGLAGELCIGGSGVASGYIGREDFTAERFVDDPNGGRMYRTGDLVRRHSDGAIEFLGRADGQVKIRGYRVEPGEIEAILSRHESVTHAAVMALAEPSGDLRLVAYVCGEVGGAAGVEGLRTYLSALLPSHMVPSLILAIASMPMTPSGKIDRKALPEPSTIRMADDEYVAPRDDVEEVLAAVWADLLGIDRVGIEDDFFGLGGHSLLAAQVIARILRDFGVHLPLHTLFVAPNVAMLADLVRQEQIAAVGGDEEFERMLAELEGLDDDSVEAMLADEGGTL